MNSIFYGRIRAMPWMLIASRAVNDVSGSLCYSLTAIVCSMSSYDFICETKTDVEQWIPEPESALH